MRDEVAEAVNLALRTARTPTHERAAARERVLHVAELLAATYLAQRDAPKPRARDLEAAARTLERLAGRIATAERELTRLHPAARDLAEQAPHFDPLRYLREGRKLGDARWAAGLGAGSLTILGASRGERFSQASFALSWLRLAAEVGAHDARLLASRPRGRPPSPGAFPVGDTLAFAWQAEGLSFACGTADTREWPEFVRAVFGELGISGWRPWARKLAKIYARWPPRR